MNNNTNNNQNKEKKKMNVWLKFLIGLAGIGCVGLISYGIYTLQTTKDNEIKDAATNVSTIIEVTDNTQNEIEQVVDKTIQYQEEAQKLWTAYGDKLICTEQQFINEYIDYRGNGLTEKQAWNTLYNAYGKEFQTQVNENGEAVAEPGELDAVINSYDENIEEEVTAPVEDIVVEFEVQELEPTTLYAIQSVNLRQGPSAKDFSKIGSLSARQQVTVVGIVKEYKGEAVLWYQLNTGEFVSGAYLVEKLPAETPQQQPSQGSTGQQSSGGTVNVGGLQFPEGSSNSGLSFGGQATTEGDGVDPSLRLQ